MSGEHPFDPREISIPKEKEPETMLVADKDGRAYPGTLIGYDERTGDPVFKYLKGEKVVPRKDWEAYKKLLQ